MESLISVIAKQCFKWTLDDKYIILAKHETGIMALLQNIKRVYLCIAVMPRIQNYFCQHKWKYLRSRSLNTNVKNGEIISISSTLPDISKVVVTYIYVLMNT